MDDTKKQVPAGWLEALAISEAELAAGLAVPLEEVLQEFDEDIRKFESARKQSPVRQRVAHRR
jgi:hypothetical protein